MNVESALGYVTLHSQSIIQWLFLVIVMLVGTLVAQALFFKRELADAGADGAPADLTAQLNKLIEASTRASGPDGAGAIHAGGESAGDPRHVHQLEAELKARAEEIAILKEAVNAGPAVGANDGQDGRLKELEAKLAEYEILEDDIADLSLYKEENSRLKSELEAIKAAPVIAAPAPVEAPTMTAAIAPSNSAPDSATARTAEAAAQAAAAAAAFDEPPVPAPAATKSTAEAADDLFAEFATALEEGGATAPEGNKAG